MKNWTKVVLLRVLFYIVTIVPTSITILLYFDVFTGERALSALTVMMLLVVLSVFWRRLVQALKSPALWQLSLFLWGFFTVAQKIADKMDVILAVFAASSCCGALIWRIAENIAKYGRARKPIAVTHTPDYYT